jgi:hypothetical protein
MQAKRNLANKIKEQLLEAHTKEELTAMKEKHGENQTNWVWRNLLSEGEREKLRAIAKTEQLDLLSLAPGTERHRLSLLQVIKYFMPSLAKEL